jgi:anti-sigma factor RsiW
MSATVTCRELADFLADYLSGELEPEARDAFDGHLAHCPSCVNYLNTYRDTVTLARGAMTSPDDPVSDDVPEDLVKAILAARRH